MTTNWPKVDKFSSEEEIVDLEFEELKQASFKDIQAFIKYGSSIGYHYGMHVRNKYHLWHPENPHTMKNYVPEIKNGADCSPVIRTTSQVVFSLLFTLS